MQKTKTKLVAVRMTDDLHQAIASRAIDLVTDPSTLIRASTYLLLAASDHEVMNVLREERLGAL